MIYLHVILSAKSADIVQDLRGFKEVLRFRRFCSLRRTRLELDTLGDPRLTCAASFSYDCLLYGCSRLYRLGIPMPLAALVNTQRRG